MLRPYRERVLLGRFVFNFERLRLSDRSVADTRHITQTLVRRGRFHEPLKLCTSSDIEASRNRILSNPGREHSSFDCYLLTGPVLTAL